MYRQNRQILGGALLLEGFIFLLSYQSSADWAECFKLSARYSGRASALVFFTSLGLFLRAQNRSEAWVPLLVCLKFFALIHLIHLGFLATNIYLNEIPIVPSRLAGGALAYLLIIIAAWRFRPWRRGFQYLYFTYVNLVVFLTYLARVQGKFEGAETHWIHYIGISLAGLGFLMLLIYLFKSRK